MTYPVKAPKKLIEVALPLDSISAAAAREKSIRYGHPSTLHLWWSRKPLAAARAVLFAQLVNDPSWKWEVENPGQVAPNHLKASWSASRKRLFKIIEDLVLWENTTNETVLEKARAEIRKSWREVCELNKDHPQAAELFNPEKLPALHDPFAGGGSIPLEAQRLGLEAYASDLNPVAVLINKAMIEIPPKFAGRAPVGPVPEGEQQTTLVQDWPGATGLAEDVRRYGAWMREEAQKRIGHLYPPVEITTEMARERPDLKPLVGQKLTVIAWLYCRTVKSPNPAFTHQQVPLVTKFWLSSRPGSESYVLPVIDKDGYKFTVRFGEPDDVKLIDAGTQLSRGSFRCIFSNSPISYSYIDDEANAGRMQSKLMGVVAEAGRRRVYLSPTVEDEAVAESAKPQWKPDAPTRGTWASNAQGRRYGFKIFGDYFTKRQLVALNTFSDLVHEIRGRVQRDAVTSGMQDDERTFNNGGTLATAYADAVTVYLSFALSKITNIGSSMASWMSDRGAFRETFARQGIAMAWDFVEANPFSDSGGSLSTALDKCAMAIAAFPASITGFALQANATMQAFRGAKVISTDPPYYDNVGYADLADFFYVWLRRSLRDVFPELFAGLASPKGEELFASPYRHGSKQNAESFFMEGMTQAIHRFAEQSHPVFPVTIFYAFKQAETQKDGTASTGWETFLEAVISASFTLSGTWPMRTEGAGRIVAQEANSLASSILLVCRKRPDNAPTISRREFIRELNAVLPEALDEMTKGSGDDQSPVAPVDLSQAIIGPGMAVFSKYAAVLEADGTPMSVRTALQLINRFLAEDDFDHDTQFCLHWFDQYGWKEGRFGEADVLARAKATSVGGLAEGGVLRSGGGVVRLLRPDEYPAGWNPQTDARRSVWETLHHLIRAQRRDGDSGAGRVLAAVKGQAEAARQLAYRLYTLCERRGWADDARAYNELITGWSGIESAAGAASSETQSQMFDS